MMNFLTLYILRIYHTKDNKEICFLKNLNLQEMFPFLHVSK